MVEYTVAQKLAGLDLHGLPCRIPEPVGREMECSHTEEVWQDHPFHGYWSLDGVDWIASREKVEVTAMRDIPGTNNMKCARCGYTRRY